MPFGFEARTRTKLVEYFSIYFVVAWRWNKLFVVFVYFCESNFRRF